MFINTLEARNGMICLAANKMMRIHHFEKIIILYNTLVFSEIFLILDLS